VSARAAALAAWHSWPVFLVRYYARQMWEDLPGPWPVKVALLALCLACPGQLDEIALIALTRACRPWRARREAARAAQDLSQKTLIFSPVWRVASYGEAVTFRALWRRFSGAKLARRNLRLPATRQVAG
jgi:hypothetical protein